MCASLSTRLFGSGLDRDADDVPISTWENAILSDFSILHVDEWPEERSERFGEESIRRLCARFGLDETKSVRAMRDYVEDPTEMPKGLLEIKSLIDTFAVSSSVCQRGLSQMNLACTDVRNRLLVNNLSALLFININGSPLKHFHSE